MAGTLKVDSINADSNLALKIANTAVAFIDATGLRPVAGNLNLDATATSKFYLPSANTVAIQTAGVTAVTVDSSQNVTLAGTLTTTGITNSGVATATRFNPTGSSVTGNGMYLPAANSLGLSTNGTNAVYIDSSQKVGIGTSSPSNKLDVFNSTFGGSNTSFILSSVNSASAKINFSGIGYTVDQGSAGIEAGSMYFSTYGSGALTERMRIDSSGSVLVGTTSVSTITGEATAKAQVAGNFVVGNAVAATNLCMTLNGVVNKAGRVAFAESGAIKWLIGNGAASENGVFEVYSNTTGTGVQLGRSATAWSSASDERIKDIIEPITDAVNKIAKLRAVIGKYKTDESGTRRSFLIAQDVQAVLPEAIDDIDAEKLGIRYTEVIPLLVAAIKELKAINDTQAATITTLTARIVALENR